jgi:hypothetical protein
MISLKTIFAYGLYALLAVALFLVLLFPDQTVKAYVDGRLAAIDPSLSMAVETIRPAIPPGLKMIGVDLNRDSVCWPTLKMCAYHPTWRPCCKTTNRPGFRRISPMER